MSVILATLRKTPYLLLTLVLAAMFFAVYTLFDLRQGGTHLTVFSLHLEPFQYFLSRFGWGYVLGRVLLNICISFLSALLLAFTLDSYRGGNAVFTGSACSTGATLLLGLFTFGCPSCVLPIAGTFGALFTSSALPLFGFEFKLLSLLMILGTFWWLLYRVKRSSAQEPVSSGFHS